MNVALAEAWGCTDGATPLNVVAKGLLVEDGNRVGALSCGHVAPLVGEEDEEVFGLIANARVLEAKEVADVLARRVHDHGVLGEAGGEVRGVEVVVGFGGGGE